MSELKTGDQIPFVAQPAVLQAQLNAYAEASGDHNRIHLDEGVAKASGLPGVIAHGMLSAAFIAERAQTVVLSSRKYLRFRPLKSQTRFKAMVLLGDVVSVGGTVKTADDFKIILDLQAKNQRGEIVTTGTVEFSSN